MFNLLLHILDASRPRLWIKNLGLFLPLFISGQFFVFEKWDSVLLGIASFCLLSSSNYILNDILDAAKDKKHPLKRHRPIAKQAITIEEAIAGVLLLGIGGMVLAFLVNPSFFLLAFLFVFIHQLSYFWFRTVPVVDVLAIASGYLLRIMAGEQASGTPMTVWFFLVVLSSSLLLAIGKRRNEMMLIEDIAKTDKEFKKENFLYSEKILDSYVAVFASAAFLSYAYYTFLSSPVLPGLLFRGYAEYVIQVLDRKWMMITIPFVLYGVMRYVQLVYLSRGILAKAITTDKPLIITMFLWVITLIFVVYGIGG